MKLARLAAFRVDLDDVKVEVVTEAVEAGGVREMAINTPEGEEVEGVSHPRDEIVEEGDLKRAVKGCQS